MSWITALELPKEIDCRTAVVTAIGGKEIHIENHRGILEFSSEILRVRCRENTLTVRGENLKVQNYSKEEIHMVGSFHDITFI